MVPVTPRRRTAAALAARILVLAAAMRVSAPLEVAREEVVAAVEVRAWAAIADFRSARGGADGVGGEKGAERFVGRR